jgi:hypothetical protein
MFSSTFHEVVIGTGNHGNSSSIIVDSEKLSISRNETSYWIELKFPFEIWVTVFKDTEQGRKVTKFIKLLDKKGQERFIYNYLFKEMLKRVRPELLYNRIKESNDEAYRKGEADKLAKIKEVLEID